MGRYSYSSIKMFDECPLRYYQRKVEMREEPVGEGALCGRFGHNVAEFYIKDLLKTGSTTDYSKLRALIDKHQVDLVEVDEVEAEAITEAMLNWGENFILPEGERIAVELGLAFDAEWNVVLWDSEKARFRARLDLVFFEDSKTVVITDWKSDRHLPKRVAVVKSWQLKIYAFLMAILEPTAENFIVRLHFLRYGVEHELVFSREELLSVHDELVLKFAEIDECVDFEARVGSHCEFCGFIPECPKMMGALIVNKNPYVLVTEENAFKAAELLFALDRVKKEVNDCLKDYVKRNGPVELNNQVLGFHPTQSTKYPDLEELAGALVKTGLDRDAVWSAFSATKSSVEKTLKKGKKLHLLDDVKEAAGAIDKVGSRFEFKKVA